MVDIERLKRKEMSAWFEDFKAQIVQKEDIVFVDDGKTYKQILSVLSNNKGKGIITTPQTLFDKFSAIPFGWDKMAILYYLVILKRKGKLEIKLNGKELGESEVKSAILRTENSSKLALDVVTDEYLSFCHI